MQAFIRRAGTTSLVAVTLLALGCALGAVFVGHGVLVPAVRAADLVDPNLARALSGPLALRASELLLVACIVLTMTSPRAMSATGITRNPRAKKLLSSLALLAAGLAAVDRVVVLPKTLHAWGQVDIVAARPRAAFETAEQLGQVHAGILLAVLVCLIAGSTIAAHRLTRPGGE